MKVFREDGSVLIEELVLARGFRRYIGLMFRLKMPYEGLLLSMEGTEFIHSFFVFFPFKAIFLDDDFRVVETCIMKPFTVKRVKADWVLETSPEKVVKKGETLVIR
ncbi:DUF192 domain-containing protein [Archaeoglobus veneficus]|uniref:DUF192 domain-containing protein n=1 Tax=Archaeoglobus veneficus (strain DSM 11195 / SNP6) TaxID=693661 RepID=F2KNE5_ARCVS|nr:DUF192 domain-containing protein [Archaeoglobus veneficus]AEA47347.1 protein of unknown function DUF192 [Archaeoglobus veneficus SNP6]